MIKPQTSSIAYTRAVARLTAQSVVQTRLADSDGVSEVLVVCPQVSLIGCEVSSGRVNYSGKIIFTVAFCDEEGKLCRMQRGAEFSHFCDDASLAPAQTAVCALSCERVGIRRDGSAIVLSAVVTAQIDVFSPAERTFITSCDGAYLKTQLKEFFSYVSFSGECEVEDDFEADGVDDILVPAAEALVCAASCGTGEVEVSGDINLSLLAMRKGAPAGFERAIPFRCIVPCEDSASGALPRVCAEVRDMNVNAAVDDERGKCRIQFTCTLAVRGSFGVRSEQTVATDAFSCTNAVESVRAEESACVVCERKVYSERISSAASSKAKLDFSCRFLAVACPRVEYEYSSSAGAVEGAVLAVLLYEQGGEVRSTQISMPFSEGRVEGEGLVKVSVEYPRNSSVSYLVSAEEGQPLPPDPGAITVIVPASGDTLWDAARKLGCPPDEVFAFNPGLKYPLSGRERVLVYKKSR